MNVFVMLFFAVLWGVVLLLVIAIPVFAVAYWFYRKGRRDEEKWRDGN
jgi:predicted PurR-regulated permease PerM